MFDQFNVARMKELVFETKENLFRNGENVGKTCLKREKMLVTSIFSVSKNVF